MDFAIDCYEKLLRNLFSLLTNETSLKRCNKGLFVGRLHCSCNSVWTGSLLNASFRIEKMLIVLICKGFNLESNDFDLPQRLVILIGLESDEVNRHLENCQMSVLFKI